MNVYQDLIAFLKNPDQKKDKESNLTDKIIQFVVLFITCFTISIFLSIVISIIYATGLIENDYHAFDQIKDKQPIQIFFIAAIAAPVVEELIFRGPLTIFKSPWKLYRKSEETGEKVLTDVRIPIFENPKVFKIIFYSSAILFGYVHLFNYQIDTQILIFSPILVAPQFILGLIFGYIRIRFGLLWSIAMHSLYNGFLVSLFIISKDAIQ